MTVALGVLLDTLIVRSVLVTALNLDLGGKIWWPSKLDRDPVIDAPDVLENREKVSALTRSRVGRPVGPAHADVA